MPTFAVLRHASILLGILLLIALPAQAEPPPAPTELTVEFTRYGFPNNIEGISTNNAWHSWYLTWKDNALDEDGYHVQVRFGNAGPFFTANQLPPDSTFVRISTGIPDPTGNTPLPIRGVGTPIQFRIIPWKFNGTVTESSSAIITSVIPPPDSRSELAAPSNLTTSVVDADPNTPGVQPDDGKVRLSWTDNSSGELYQRLRMRENGAQSGAETGWLTIVPARFLGVEVPFNRTTVTLSNQDFILTNDATPRLVRLQLIPGKTYEFEVGAGNSYGSNGGLSIPGNYLVRTTSTTHFTVPQLAAPSFFSATPQGEAAMLLSWRDNSNNETGFEVQYRRITAEADPPWLTLGTVGENVTQVTLPIIQTANAEIRVRAIHAYRPSGASSDTVLYSAFSNPATSSTDAFRAPSALTATTSGVARSIDLTWQDNSSSEYGFNIYCRPAGTTGAYLFCRATPANVTQVRVDSYTNDSPFTSNTLNFTPFVVGNAYEFVVRAVGNDEDIESLNSASATAFARDGFTGRLYQPIQQGLPFSHQLQASNSENLTRFEASNLPPGLSLNPDNGLISGTPEASGYYPVVVRAVYAGSPTAVATLDLRVLPALGGPTLVTGAEVGDRKVGLNDPMVISLAGRFRDADTTAAVRMTTTKGSLDISLYNNLTPQAFNNFVTYAAAGDYNQMTFHRLERNFVLQGGFLRAVSAPRVFTRVNARPSPPNEPGISNVFGTIAAAKLGERTSYSRDQLGQIVRDSSGNPVVRPASAAMGYVGNPNSASIDFFFNLADNRENLDNQNGGFTVFGRVGTPGHTLLQQINQLPIGSYQNANPAGSAYNASLDRRIIIDGSLVPLSGIPMDATTAPVDMDIEKTIRVTGIQPIPSVSYSVDSQATNIATVAVEGTNLRVTGLAAGTRPVVLTATDIDGNTATTSFNIIVTPGYKRPVITRQPVSATARAGSTVRYSVTATGTSLNYRWRKNGTVIAGQTGQGSPSFTVVSAQVSDEGEYDVVVYNDAESVFSAKARLDIIKAPVITGTLPNKLVEAGKELKLEANLTEGSPAPTFTWRRGASVVPRQTTRTLLIPAASLADAGVYQATARNSVASATTTQATVVVIDKRERKQVEPPGSTVRLVAQAQGADLLYQWYRVLDNGSRQDIPGAEDPILQLSNLNPATDAGSYACEITLPLGIDPVEKHSTGITFLAVSGRPQIADTLTLADAVVGATYNNLPNYGFNGSNNALTFNILGLPPGLVYDKNTGRITGRPTRPGDYRVTFTATNKSGTSPAVIRSIRVFSMGSGLSGTFIANVSASDALNGGKGGRLNLSVTSSGAYTATLQMAKDQFRATGSMVLVNVVTDENGLTNKVYLGSATLPRRGRSSLSLTFQIVERSQSFSGFVSDGSQSADFSGHRLVWSSSFRQGPLIMVASQRYQDPLRHNVLLSLPDTLTSRTDLPQGDGYLSASVSLSGNVNFAGRMADGTRWTASGIASPYISENLEEATRSRVKSSFFQMLNNNTASVMGELDFMISDRATANIGRSGAPIELPPANHVTGSARWVKDQQPAAERSYRPGFEAITLSALGSLYQPPGTNRVVINLPNVEGNAVLNFTKAGIETATPSPNLPSFRINTAHVGVITGANQANVTLSVNPATGLLTGSFKLADNRRAQFEGLCIAASESESKLGYNYRLPRGGGFFLLPSTTSAQAPILSGKMALRTPTITFTTQPVSVTINPGSSTTVEFTAEATGMPGLNYQWFFNGTRITNGGTISGAQTRTLTITGPVSENEGSYVCVAFSGSISVPSNNATLTLRKPVTSVTLARSPSDEVIENGTIVSFTATAQGSTTIDYEWYLNGNLISGPTGRTYSFVASPSRAGVYTVKARNDLNTVGVFITSNEVSLEVTQPVTNVVLTRTPADETLVPGQDVNFTAVADGDGEKTYTWMKNGQVISSGTSNTFTLNNIQTTDNGAYVCRVTSSSSPSYVDSNEVLLFVADLIRDVVASRTPSTEFLLEGTASVTFSVTSEGGGSGLNYLWRRGVVELQNSTSPTLVLNNITVADSGEYTCLVTSEEDPDGALSNAVNLTVLRAITSVSISLHSPATTVVAPGQELEFRSQVNGDATQYAWLLNGEALNVGTPVLSISAPEEPGIYQYRMVAFNPISHPEGFASDPILIEVQAP